MLILTISLYSSLDLMTFSFFFPSFVFFFFLHTFPVLLHIYLEFNSQRGRNLTSFFPNVSYFVAGATHYKLKQNCTCLQIGKQIIVFLAYNQREWIENVALGQVRRILRTCMCRNFSLYLEKVIAGFRKQMIQCNMNFQKVQISGQKLR